MTDAVVVAGDPPTSTDAEKALEWIATRDLSLLEPEQRGAYLYQLHKAMGINPLSRAFDFISVQGPGGKMRTILYANRTAADQLAHIHKIESRDLYKGPLKLGDLIRPDIYVVELQILKPEVGHDGLPYFRTITSVGAVTIGGMQGDKLLLNQGDALSNAYMKAHTKAWRRGVLQIMGCGFPDESEVDTIPGSSSPMTEPAPRLLTPSAEPSPPPPSPPSNYSTPITTAKLPRPLPAARPPR
jgi:hypothetical protein